MAEPSSSASNDTINQCVDETMSVDDTFHLDGTTRAHIAPEVDVDALERLLQRLEPEGRSITLDFFLLPEYRLHTPPPNQWMHLRGFTDPVLNELLAEVGQPFWDAQPDEILHDPYCHYPGQALARQRRRKHS